MHPHKSTVDQWLHTRVPGARLDENGVAAVRRDDDTLVIVEVPPDSDVCHLCALVGPLPEGLREPALFTALEMNRFGRPLAGCWLALEPEIEMLTLCHNINIPVTDGIAFANTLDNFMTAIDIARAQLVPSEAVAAGERAGAPELMASLGV